MQQYNGSQLATAAVNAHDKFVRKLVEDHNFHPDIADEVVELLAGCYKQAESTDDGTKDIMDILSYSAEESPDRLDDEDGDKPIGPAGDGDDPPPGTDSRP